MFRKPRLLKIPAEVRQTGHREEQFGDAGRFNRLGCSVALAAAHGDEDTALSHDHAADK